MFYTLFIETFIQIVDNRPISKYNTDTGNKDSGVGFIGLVLLLTTKCAI